MQKIVPHEAILIPDEAECVFSGIIYNVFQWQQKLFDGSQTTFEMLRRQDTAVIVGVVDGKVLIITDEQPNRGPLLGFPGGRIEWDEDALTGAKREMLEETGYQFSDWKLISVDQPSQKMEWFTYVYLASGGARVAGQRLDGGEKITVEMKNFDEVKAMTLTDNGRFDAAAENIVSVDNLEQLLASPEYHGETVDR